MRRNRRLILVFAVLFSLGVPQALRALSRSDILFYVAFDQGPDAEIAGGDRNVTTKGEPVLVEGRIGKAFTSKGETSQIICKTKDNFDIQGGTLALWLKPVGWTMDRKMRHWFSMTDAKSGESFLWLYKFFQGDPVFWLSQQSYNPLSGTIRLVGGPSNRNYYGIGDPYPGWKDGQWCHVTATWCGRYLRLYINGKSCGSTVVDDPPLLHALPDTFILATTSDSIIDEVYILNRPITEPEAKALCEKGAAAFDGVDSPAVLEIQTCNFFPSSGKLNATIVVDGRHPVKMTPVSVRLDIEEAKMAKRFEKLGKEIQLTDIETEVSLNVSALPPGDYRLIAQPDGKDEVIAPASAEFAKAKKPEWLGNRIGCITGVPEPWTPIRRNVSWRHSLPLVPGPADQEVSVWGRTYRYHDSLFPSQILSQGRELLAGPVELIAERGGSRIPLSDARFKWARATPARVEYKVTAKLDDIRVECEGWIEYDGFTYSTLRIVPPPGGGKLDRLSLRLPLRKEIATLQQTRRDNVKARGGKVYSWNDVFGDGRVWLGNEAVGLQWFADDNYAWQCTETKRMVQVEVGDREVTLTANLLDHTVTLERPCEYTFGLVATPVRPLPRNWRTLDYGWDRSTPRPLSKRPGPQWNVWACDWNAQAEASIGGAYGYPSVGYKTREMVNSFMENHIRFFPYFDMRVVWRGAPEYKFYRSEWCQIAPPALPMDQAGPGDRVGVDHNVPSFRDWFIWQTWHTFHDNPWLMENVAGFYLDEVERSGGYAKRVGEDGQLHERTNMLGVREVQKRFYNMVKSEWPDRFIINHQSGNPEFSHLGFADCYITGEDFYSDPFITEDANYYRALDLDNCRATMAAEAWGVPVAFLTMMSGSKPGLMYDYATGIKGAEHVAGMLLIHDVIPYPTINPIPFNRLDSVKQTFGWDEDTEFIGYWKSGDLVTITADQSPVVVSVFRRPGKVLFAMINNSDNDAQVSLKPDWAKLGVTEPAFLTDAYQAIPVETKTLNLPAKTVREPVQDHGVRLNVAARNFRVLTTQP